MMPEKRPVVRPQSDSQSWVRVSTLDGEPLADVDMSSGERLEVWWPCRIDFISISGGGGA